MLTTIGTAELKEMKRRKDEFVLVNVLPEDDFIEGHIPGSQNVPVTRRDFTQAIGQITVGLDQPIVVYCASEDCDASPIAAKKLERLGYTRVLDYEAGMEGWMEAGLRVEKGG